MGKPTERFIAGKQSIDSNRKHTSTGWTKQRSPEINSIL